MFDTPLLIGTRDEILKKLNNMKPVEGKSMTYTVPLEEEMRLALDRRTVDAVNTGEQQPEADHGMKFDRSNKGNFQGEPWRDASNGGYFSYMLSTDNLDSLALLVANSWTIFECGVSYSRRSARRQIARDGDIPQPSRT